MKTQDQIIEGNKLIAKFMGYTDGPDHLCLVHPTSGMVMDMDYFEYHSSWDWIMPVVYTIHELLNEDWFEDHDELSFTLFPKSLDELYGHVIEYIQWYNERENGVWRNKPQPEPEEAKDTYIRLLSNLERAYVELIKFYNDGNVDPDAEFHQTAMQYYPFEQSFDDYLQPLRYWIEKVKEELTEHEYTVTWVETEAYEKALTVKATSAQAAIEKVRKMEPSEAERAEFLHMIEQTDFKIE